MPVHMKYVHHDIIHVQHASDFTLFIIVNVPCTCILVCINWNSGHLLTLYIHVFNCGISEQPCVLMLMNIIWRICIHACDGWCCLVSSRTCTCRY